MATGNPFDLLGDNDNDDPSQLIAAQLQQQKAAPKKAPAPTQGVAPKQQPHAKLPSKPLPPSQAAREAKNDMGASRGGGRGGARGLGRGRGGGGSGFNRDSGNNENTFNNGAVDDGDVGRSSERGRGSYSGGPRGAYRGSRRGGFSNGEAGDGDRPPRRQFERRSGTGRGNEIKRDGAGRGNWGTQTDDVFAQETEEVVNAIEKNLSQEQQPGEEDVNKENTVTEPEEKEPEDKEMTLEEYEKVVEEKRKALQALKTEERKVRLDKELESMQQLASKKNNDDVFIKLGSEKDKRKEIMDKEEKLKKPVSINEFLKPAEGERYYSPGGRGRGRGGRGSRGGFSGGNVVNNAPAPSIEDPGQFPTLGAK